jgi:hypothetical protein
MRYILTVDFEDGPDVDAFLGFIRFHASRMKCLEKDVFVRLANEWKKANSPAEIVVKEKKKLGS